MSPVRSHQVGFYVESSPDGMQLNLRPNDTVNVTWQPEEVIPSHLFTNLTEIRINIQLFQQHDTPRNSTSPRWIEIPDTQMTDLNNTGVAQFTVPEAVKLQPCLGQEQLCPVAFRVSAVTGTRVTVRNVGPVALPIGQRAQIGIWSGVGYLQSHTATTTSLGVACQNWNQSPKNDIPTSIRDQLPICPPTEAQAIVDSRFRVEDLRSAFGEFDTGYAENTMKFHYPGARVCYVETVMNRRYVRTYEYNCMLYIAALFV